MKCGANLTLHDFFAGSANDWLRHSVLNRVCYGINSGPDKSAFECSYADADPEVDRLFLLLDKGVAVGFW